MTRPPASVLFACNFNRVRSPMAEAMVRAFYGDQVYVDSCGMVPEDSVDPLVVQVMSEIGVDASTHVAQSFADLEPDAFDLVVSFTPEAHAQAMEMAQGSAVQVEYWPLSDPTLSEGSRETVLEGYRQVRDQLRARLAQRFGPSAAG